MATKKKVVKKTQRRGPIHGRKLPDVPSKLLNAAVDDLEAVERSKRFAVNMANFVYEAGGPCEVCLGGAALVCSLDVKRDVYGKPSLYAYPDSARQKAIALDYFRQGEIESALGELGYSEDDIDSVTEKLGCHFDVCYYDTNPTLFKAQMRSLARQLKAVGH